MATFSGTITNTIVGTLDNGRKIVSSDLTVYTGGIDATTFTITPIRRITSWIANPKVPGFTATAPVDIIFTAGSASNTLVVDPNADASGAVINFTSVGI